MLFIRNSRDLLWIPKDGKIHNLSEIKSATLSLLGRRYYSLKIESN